MTRYTEGKIYTAHRENIQANPYSWKNENGLYIPTVKDLDSETLEGVQQLPVRVARGSKHAELPVFIHAQAWSDIVDEENVERSVGTLRDMTEATVVSVGFPGMGGKSSSMTEKQFEGLQEGSFAPIAESQWEAARLAYAEAFGGEDLFSKEVILSANSMGASQVLAMATTAPEGANLRKLIQIENVALAPWGKTRRQGLKNIGTMFATNGGQDFAGHYDKLHPDILEYKKPLGGIVLRALFRPKSYITAVAALGEGKDGERIITTSHEIPVTLVNGELSLLSSTDANDGVAKRGHKGNVDREVLAGEYHGASSDPVVLGAAALKHGLGQ